MSRYIEAEKKYYCANYEDLISILKTLNFDLVSNRNESDEYFTDINSEYVKNRTCLRLRLLDDNLIITFKGKSNVFSNSFCKLESNYEQPIHKYSDITNLFNCIGFYSYVTVKKNRYAYYKKSDIFTYGVMIDYVKGIGDFVEFEILCDEDNFDEIELKTKLNDFLDKFKFLKLEEANLPYRDFVASKIYNDYLPKSDLIGIHLNIDLFLKKYEKEFYKYFKDFMKKKYQKKITITSFRNEVFDLYEDDYDILDAYFNNVVIKDCNFIITFELLKKISLLNLNIVISTNCARIFIDRFISRIFSHDLIEKVIYLNNSKALYKDLLKFNVNLSNYFDISNKDIKEVNSILLVIINNLYN